MSKVKVTKDEIRVAVVETGRANRRQIVSEFTESIKDHVKDFANNLVQQGIGDLAKELEARLNHVEEFFETLKEEEYEWFRAIHSDYMPPLMKRGRMTEAIIDTMLKAIEHEITVYAMRRGVDSIRSYLRYHSTIPIPAVDAIGKEIAAIMSTQEAKDVQKSLEDIDKLTREIDTIIDRAPNGKKAYEQLTELGVDLSSLVQEERNLPSTKLSVDPAIINPVKMGGDENDA